MEFKVGEIVLNKQAKETESFALEFRVAAIDTEKEQLLVQGITRCDLLKKVDFDWAEKFDVDFAFDKIYDSVVSQVGSFSAREFLDWTKTENDKLLGMTPEDALLIVGSRHIKELAHQWAQVIVDKSNLTIRISGEPYPWSSGMSAEEIRSLLDSGYDVDASNWDIKGETGLFSSIPGMKVRNCSGISYLYQVDGVLGELEFYYRLKNGKFELKFAPIGTFPSDENSVFEIKGKFDDTEDPIKRERQFVAAMQIALNQGINFYSYVNSLAD